MTNEPEHKKLNISENQYKIMELLEEAPYANAEDIAHEVGITFRKTKELLKKLRNKELVERIGDGQGGYWRISDSFRD